MTRPIFVFAHGAGASSSSAWMAGWKTRLETLGDVHSFDYPYMAAGSRRPDRLPALVSAHREVVQNALSSRTAPLILVGKSMGSRVGCHVATEPHLLPAPVLGLVCLGYPLVGQNGQLRDQVLHALRVPVLFVQGTRDKLCPLDRLEQARAKMTTTSALYVVDGGDHSLMVTKTQLKRSGTTQTDEDTKVLEAIARFVTPLTQDPI